MQADDDDFDAAEAAMRIIFALLEKDAADGPIERDSDAYDDSAPKSLGFEVMERLDGMGWSEILAGLMEGMALGWIASVELGPESEKENGRHSIGFGMKATTRGKRAARAYAHRNGWTANQ